MSSENISKLKLDNEMLRSELEDLKFRYDSLKKQQNIWCHIEDSNIIQQKQTLMENQITYFQSQIVSLVTEKQLLETNNQELKEKIADLKYRNQQLKQIHAKQTEIHKKELEIIKKQNHNQDNKILQQRMQKCQEIVKQMEGFYKHQIKQKDNQIANLKTTIASLQQDLDNYKQNEEETAEKQFQQMIKIQSQQKKSELMLTQLREVHERQVISLKDRIKFLIVKIQSLQDHPNQYYPSMYDDRHSYFGPQIAQSKILPCNESSDCIGMSQNGSFFDSASCRNTLVTPHKYQQATSTRSYTTNLAALSDKTNL